MFRFLKTWNNFKYVFVGTIRLATTMVKRKGAAVLQELGVYYYHGAHLGLSNVITDRSGQVL